MIVIHKRVWISVQKKCHVLKRLAFVFSMAVALFTTCGRAEQLIEHAHKNILVMGYNDTAKFPLINAAPDNSGAYLELYQKAANKIGFELRVVRLPKLRVYKMMKTGEIDFYPGMEFDQSRSEYAYFIENGLPKTRFGISRLDLQTIKHVSELKGKMVLLNYGGIDYTEGYIGISKNEVANLDIERAYELIKLENRGDFYATDDVTVVSFIKTNKVKNLKIHRNFMSEGRMTLGFSKNSKFFQEVKNIEFNPSEPVSIKNQPVLPSKSCVA